MNYDKLGSNTEISPARARSLANLKPAWVKGQSGNPNGRPPRGPASEIYEKILEDPEFKEQFKQATKERMLSRGVAGFLMSREVVDRIEGPVKQELSAEITFTLADGINKARQRAEE